MGWSTGPSSKVRQVYGFGRAEVLLQCKRSYGASYYNLGSHATRCLAVSFLNGHKCCATSNTRHRKQSSLSGGLRSKSNLDWIGS
jgi:hypothetical protein